MDSVQSGPSGNPAPHTPLKLVALARIKFEAAAHISVSSSGRRKCEGPHAQGMLNHVLDPTGYDKAASAQGMAHAADARADGLRGITITAGGD